VNDFDNMFFIAPILEHVGPADVDLATVAPINHDPAERLVVPPGQGIKSYHTPKKCATLFCMATPKGQITVRLAPNQTEIVEAWRIYFDALVPGAITTSTEVIRSLIARAGMPPSVKKHSNGKRR
jgi:hypothetical protein